MKSKELLKNKTNNLELNKRVIKKKSKNQEKIL